MSLKEELDAFRSEFMAQAPPQIREAMVRANELRPIYMPFGHTLPDKNGDESCVLPIPSTYVIDTDGTIALAFVDVDYSNRLDPAEIFTALQSLSKEHRGEHHANTSR